VVALDVPEVLGQAPHVVAVGLGDLLADRADLVDQRIGVGAIVIGGAHWVECSRQTRLTSFDSRPLFLSEDYVRHVPTDRSTAFESLTPREREVLQLVAEGKTTKEIAGRLHVSVKTIEAHRAQIMDKLQIHSIAGLTKFAVHERLTSSEP
jgi:DNA-binding NarL/FixJ family response regulator